MEQIEEGYLFKKKPKAKLGLNPMKMVVGVVNTMNQMIKDWDQRYFRLRKGHLYWYLNDRSREAQNKLDLKLVDDVLPHPTKPGVFKIVTHFHLLPL